MIDWVVFHAEWVWHLFLLYLAQPIGLALLVIAPIGLALSLRHVLQERSSHAQCLQSSAKSADR